MAFSHPNDKMKRAIGSRCRELVCQEAHAHSCGGRYPIDRTVETDSPARGAGSQLARRQMFAQFLPAQGQGPWVNMGLRPIPRHQARIMRWQSLLYQTGRSFFLRMRSHKRICKRANVCTLHAGLASGAISKRWSVRICQFRMQSCKSVCQRASAFLFFSLPHSIS